MKEFVRKLPTDIGEILGSFEDVLENNGKMLKLFREDGVRENFVEASALMFPFQIWFQILSANIGSDNTLSHSSIPYQI